MDINLKVPAIEKLLDYAASGIGSVAGPMLASWKAQQEASAKLIAAKGEAEAQRILAEGQAQTMQIIASAQADARAVLVSPDAAVQGQLDFGAVVTQRIQFQEEKRLSNYAATIGQTAQELGDREVQDHEVDHDWTARFFNDVQDVSSKEMQSLWAKILAGEVERPGSTSIKTLSILNTLDRTTATLFRRLCSMCVLTGFAEHLITDARVPSLDCRAEGNALKPYGLDFGNLNLLNEHGLIISEYDSWLDFKRQIGIVVPGTQTFGRFPFYFQGKRWVLVAKRPGVQGNEFRVSGVALTKSGLELSKVVDLEPIDDYESALISYFERNGLQMTELADSEPQRSSTH